MALPACRYECTQDYKLLRLRPPSTQCQMARKANFKADSSAWQLLHNTTKHHTDQTDRKYTECTNWGKDMKYYRHVFVSFRRQIFTLRVNKWERSTKNGSEWRLLGPRRHANMCLEPRLQRTVFVNSVFLFHAYYVRPKRISRSHFFPLFPKGFIVRLEPFGKRPQKKFCTVPELWD